MAKLVLDDIGSTLTNTAATTINNNNAKIEIALENTLSRDGTIPNNMAADIDMNSNDLLNVDNLQASSIILGGSVLVPGEVAAGQIATQAEAEAGINNTKIMTPLRAKQGAEFYSLQKTGGTMTGAIIGDDGGTHRSSKWFFNDIRDSGATVASTDLTSVFDAAKAISSRIVIPQGDWRLSTAYNLGGLDLLLKPGAQLLNPSGGVFNGSADGAFLGDVVERVLHDEDFYGQTGVTRITSPHGVMLADAKDMGTDVSGPGIMMFERWYDGTAASNSQRVVNNVESFVRYGFRQSGGAHASGSMRGIGSGIHVKNVDNASAGVSDLQAQALYIKHLAPDQGADIIDGVSTWGQEITASGKIGSATSWDAVLGGSIIVLQKYTGGRAAQGGDNYAGAWAMSLFTTAQETGFSPHAMNYETYQLDAMLAIGGWTGTSSAVDSGTHANAKSAATRAIQIGGERLSPWQFVRTARSRFDTGVSVTDYLNEGIAIFSAHPSATDPFAIKVFEDAGRIILGVNSPSAGYKAHIGNTSGALDRNLKLYESSHATSVRSGLDFGTHFVLSTDTLGDGTADIGLYQNSIAGLVYQVGATGKTRIGLPNAAATGAPLTVSATTEQLNNNIVLDQSGHATSNRASISYGGQWFAGHDIFGTGSGAWGILRNGAGNAAISIGTNDKTTIFNFVFGTTFTPANSADPNGATNEMVADLNFIYVKTSAGWKRSAIAAF